MSLLEVANLRISTRRGVPLVKGIDFAVERGEWFALIGESGSGKSITSSSITNLQATSLKREADAIDFDSLDDAEFSELHRAVDAFLWTPRAQEALWPHLDDHGRYGCMESFMEAFA